MTYAKQNEYLKQLNHKCLTHHMSCNARTAAASSSARVALVEVEVLAPFAIKGVSLRTRTSAIEADRDTHLRVRMEIFVQERDEAQHRERLR
jgi:hypothetical protein